MLHSIWLTESNVLYIHSIKTVDSIYWDGETECDYWKKHSHSPTTHTNLSQYLYLLYWKEYICYLVRKQTNKILANICDLARKKEFSSWMVGSLVTEKFSWSVWTTGSLLWTFYKTNCSLRIIKVEKSIC